MNDFKRISTIFKALKPTNFQLIDSKEKPFGTENVKCQLFTIQQTNKISNLNISSVQHLQEYSKKIKFQMETKSQMGAIYLEL